MASIAWPLIFGLFFPSSPSAIIWLVILVIVISFYCVHILRTFSHVLKEITECHPSFAHFNSSSAVPFVTMMLFVLASANHCSPAVIGMGIAPNASSMNKVAFPFGIYFQSYTSATSAGTLAQALAKNDFLLSASTLTKPLRSAIRQIISSRYYCESSVYFPKFRFEHASQSSIGELRLQGLVS